MKIRELLDLDKTIAKELFYGHEYPWEVLPLIGDFIIKLGEALPADEYKQTGENIWIATSADVAPSASITGPAIICKNAQIRPGAFIRGNAVVGENAVVGNSTELKNVILFDNVQVPHYNYVGDSVLGYKAHMGAGSITSNVKSDKTLVTIAVGLYDGELGNAAGEPGAGAASGKKIETGLKKMGAILGDHVEVGCNSVLNPGSVIGRCTNIYPLSSIRGYVPENSIVKTGGIVVRKE